MPIADLDWALSEFRDAARTERYELARSYYLGDHRLMFAGEKFRSTFGVMLKSLSDNLMPAVIDSLTDRLELTGFAPTMETDTEAAEDVWRVWQRNMMDLRANEVHRESLLTGDSYVIVWPGQDGKAGIWPQQAGSVAVRYSFDYPGRIDLAAKLWRATDGYWRLTLYYPDRLERYRSKAPNKTLPATRNASSKFESFLPPENNVPSVQALEAVGDGGSVLPNPHGEVPVFHFPNKRLNEPGISELLDVIPLQDVLNKSVADMVVTAEFSAYRQRYVTGLDMDPNPGVPAAPPFDNGPGRIWAVSDPNARFGEFASSDLRQFLEIQDSFRAEIARVAGVPLHYLFISKGDFPSGEAMKAAEARFTRKIRDRQVSYGTVWENVLAFCLLTEGGELQGRLQSLWETASPRSEREMAETLLMKKTLGVSTSQLLREAGYNDEQIQQMAAERAAEQPVENGSHVMLPTGSGRMRIPETARRTGEGSV